MPVEGYCRGHDVVLFFVLLQAGLVNVRPIRDRAAIILGLRGTDYRDPDQDQGHAGDLHQVDPFPIENDRADTDGDEAHAMSTV